MNRIFIGIMGILFIMPIYGEIYRWVDTNGTVHFSEKQPSVILSEPIVLDPLNTYTKNDLDYENTTNWQQHDERSRDQKIKKSQKIERNHASMAKKEQQCQSSRQQLRSFEGRPYKDTSLAALQKRRQQKGTIQARIEKHCR